MDSIIRKYNPRVSESEFVSQLQDDFPDTDKMPLPEFQDTDFADSVIVEEADRDTIPAALLDEMNESKKSFDTQKSAEPLLPMWRFEFTDSALDLQNGTEVTESDEDLYKKYFDK